MHSINSVRRLQPATVPVPTQADGKEYIVCLNSGVDFAEFWQQMETNMHGPATVPQRAVRIVNERVNSLRSCHYALTDAEATALRTDPRVQSVSIPPQHKSNMILMHRAAQQGNFTKPSTYTDSTGDKINWGLPRTNNIQNNYLDTLSIQFGGQDYDYTLSGDGVDVVVMDSGLQIDHPEFTNSHSVSRVQTIDWYAASGVPGTMPPNHYQDTAGHGTHVTGIAAGKTYGWAKNANIYSIKLQGLDGGEGGTIPYWDAFDVLIGWHLNKTPDPETGLVRPTIVNMSWGFSGTYYTDETHTIIDRGQYRGTSWSGSGIVADIHTEYGMGSPEIGTFPMRDPATDSAIEELLFFGIHVCIAAGNDGIKVDVPLGPDYQNYFIDNVYYDYNFYNQGSSPYSDKALIIGATDATPHSAELDQKVFFSLGGPGVDLYVPGTKIMSSMSTTNNIAVEGYTDAPYHLNGVFKQANLSGTSMAAPQITGLGAVFLQVNPHATPQQLKSWLLYNSGNAIYTTENNNDYSNFNSIWGGASIVAYNKFNSSISLKISNDFQEIIPSPD